MGKRAIEKKIDEWKTRLLGPPARPNIPYTVLTTMGNISHKTIPTHKRNATLGPSRHRRAQSEQLFNKITQTVQTHWRVIINSCTSLNIESPGKKKKKEEKRKKKEEAVFSIHFVRLSSAWRAGCYKMFILNLHCSYIYNYSKIEIKSVAYCAWRTERSWVKVWFVCYLSSLPYFAIYLIRTVYSGI